MSVVVAIKDNDKVWIGCDSQVTTGWSKNTLSNKNNYKIFKPVKDQNVIIGVCGALRDRDILYCVEEYIEELAKLKNEVNYKYIVTKVVPKIFSTLESNGRVVKKEKENQQVNIQIIFVYGNQIFDISGDGSVIEVEDYCAIGSGMDFAIGYLNECEKTDLKQALVKSIKSSCKTDLYVNYPIVVMNTENDEVDLFYK